MTILSDSLGCNDKTHIFPQENLTNIVDTKNAGGFGERLDSPLKILGVFGVQYSIDVRFLRGKWIHGHPNDPKFQGSCLRMSTSYIH